MLHLRHATMQGHTEAYVRTVDSDVVVLTINIFHELGLSELWVGFGIGKWYKDIPIHHISQLLGPQRYKVLPLFHAITGCDVVSAMFGIGKKTVWDAWIAYPEVTDTLIAITQDPNSFTLDSLHMRHLERWTVLMYCKNCNAVAVVLPVRETVTATVLDSDVAVCASAKEVAQIMTQKAELIMAMMCAE